MAMLYFERNGWLKGHKKVLTQKGLVLVLDIWKARSVNNIAEGRQQNVGLFGAKPLSEPVLAY